MDRQRDPRALVALFLGLQSPESGTIKYSGKDWFDTNYDMQFQMRSQIGRVYSSQGWVQNLSVGENIRIGPLHQGVRLSEVEQSIANWISRLGGSSTSTVERAMNRRPAVVSNTILQVCQLIRAFAIEPKLLILESPTNYLTRELKDRLYEAISELCSRGSSVIWFDVDELPPSVRSTLRIQRWMIVNDSLQVATE
jgi:ribose transport system ATP-binding protein